MHRFLAFFVFVVALTLNNDQASAQQRFDGDWTIHATPETGACKRARRYAAIIRDGIIRGSASRPARIMGALDPSGRIQGSVVRNKTRVDVTGNLSDQSGSGTWIVAGRISCTGRWAAEKRG
jgi:hypothetical protein